MTHIRRYSDETVRTILILVHERGKSVKEVSNILNIPLVSVYCICNRYKSKYRHIIKNGSTGSRTISTDEIKDDIMKLVNDDNTISVSQILTQMKLTIKHPTLAKWLRLNGISFKLTRPIYPIPYFPEVKRDRKDYITWYQSIPINLRNTNVIFIDSCLFLIHVLQPVVRTNKKNSSKNVYGEQSVGKFSAILAITFNEIVKCQPVFTDMNVDIFKKFLEEIKQGFGAGNYWIVMGNAEFHKRKELYDDFQYEKFFLPKLSPFLNPCEQIFTKIKLNIRRNEPIQGEKDLDDRIMEVCQGVNSDELKRYFQNCEEGFESCLQEPT